MNIEYDFSKKQNNIPSAFIRLKSINWENVTYCEAQRSYTLIYFNNGLFTRLSVNLSYICKYIKLKKFIRIHRKYHVNFNYVTYIKLKKPLQICLKNTTLLPISLRKKAEIKIMVGKYLLENVNYNQKN